MSTQRGRVLVSGAGVAGPALAFWLHRYGWATTVVERAPAGRTSGQNVDVRGAGREVARRMGIEDDIRAATTGELGIRFTSRRGAVIAEFPAGTSDSGGATAELEILRGDLARLLVERSLPATDYRYGDRITAVRSGEDQVLVDFEHARPESYDLVVAADGIGSSTRRLVFGDEARIRPLGMETTWATIPRLPEDDDWWHWYNATGGRTLTLRPDAVGTIRATLSCPPGADDPHAGADRRSLPEQRARVRARFADAGWQAERILDGLERADDLYCESIGQVHAPRWSARRVVLLGDAAYCASPISGMGTSLALVGAYVLAGELATHPDHREALTGYEQIMRPYVRQAQRLPPGTPRLANPRTRAGIAVFNAGVRVAATGWAGRLVGNLFTPAAEQIQLPDYGHLTVS